MNREATKSTPPVTPATATANGTAAAPVPASVAGIPPQPAPPGQPQPVRFNAANLKSSYCNTATTHVSREEVVLTFGVNQNWERGAEAGLVNLEHRVILNPALAKRLSLLIAKALEEYESRQGSSG